MGEVLNKTLPNPSHKGRGFRSAISERNFRFQTQTNKSTARKPLPLWEGLGRVLFEIYRPVDKFLKNPSPGAARHPLPNGERKRRGNFKALVGLALLFLSLLGKGWRAERETGEGLFSAVHHA